MDNLLTSPLNRGLRLRKLRETAKFSRPQLAKIANCGESSLQFWEDGKGNGITLKSAKLLITFLNQSGVICTVDWLMEGIGSEPVLASSLTPEMDNDASDTALSEEIKAFHGCHEDAITLLIADDTMLPGYHPGDYVAGKKKFGAAIELIVNHPCIVELEDTVTLCRVLKMTTKAGYFNLVGTNAYATSETICLLNKEIISAAKVIWHRRPE